MQQIILMVGFPGSGKSTKAKEFAKQGYVIVNQDWAMQEVGRRNAKIRCINEFENLLIAGKNVVVDRCNHNKKQREEFINIAKEINPDIKIKAIVMITSPDKCARRIKKRQDHPTLDTHLDKVIKAIRHFDRQKQFPHISEGFNKIIKVYAS